MTVTAPAPPAVRRPTRAAYPLALVFFALYTALSVQRHRRAETTGYDLGIFEQSVRAYAAGNWPVSPLRGLNLLGDHFSPVVALLAPLYRLAPHPTTLLVAQAALLAVSVVPVTRLAADRLGPRAAWAVGVCYGLSWGLQRTVAFDFHEICFAVPLLAFAGEALARQRWRAAVAWTLPLLLVKEDLPLTVAAVGAYLWWRGRRRAGAALVAAGLATFALVVGVVLPGVNPHGRYEYLSALSTPDGGALAVKLATVGWLLAPTAFVALRSPLLALAVPTVAWRFASGNPNHWGTLHHYSAVLMPIVFVALVDALPRWRSPRVRAAVVAGCLAVALVHATALPLRRVAEPSFWRTPDRSVLAAVPDGADVAASNRLAPQLTRRATVRLFPLVTDAEWVVADVERREWPSTVAEMRAAVARLRAQGYATVAQRDGIVVLRGPTTMRGR